MPHSRRRGLLILAVVLLVIGICGMLATGTFYSAGSGLRGARSPRTGTFGEYASNGQRIFLTGVGHDGPIEVEWSGGMMGPGRGSTMAGRGCAFCHGTDGRGRTVGMMGFTAPDIRYKTLTSGGGDEEGQEAWTNGEIETAIRTGKEPSGDTLSSVMPRWKMDDTDMADVIGYLKELD